LSNSIEQFITNFKNSLSTFFDKPANILLLFIIFFILSIVFLTLYLSSRKISKKSLLELRTIKNLIKGIAPTKTLEENLAGILDILSPLVIAEKLSFYVKDTENDVFLLKSSKYFDDGLDEEEPLSIQDNSMDFEAKQYKPPLTININEVEDTVGIYKVGKVPVLSIPLEGGKGLIRIAPIKKLPGSVMKTVTVISRELGAVMDVISENEVLKSQAKVAVNSARATESISHIILDYEKMLENMVWISIKALNADGGMYLAGEERNKSLSFISDEDYLLAGEKSLQQLYKNLLSVLDNKPVQIIKRSDNAFSNFLNLIKDDDTSSFLVITIKDAANEDLIVFWFGDDDEIEEYRIKAVLMLKKRMEEIIATYNNSQVLKFSYIKMLKLLAQMMDNLKPHSIGNSELMARYSTIIAKAMNLSDKEVNDIALAAYLSNIGILGLSKGLIFKKGKYADVEYETMKLHTEVGASIIEATLANTMAARYVREHHERVDGYGYPKGLSGDRISVGARIIMVVQTFLAKISGRPSRDPLSFDKALEMLKKASGTQLDTEIVNILVDWFESKRSLPQIVGKTLGPCWSMRCSPEDICVQCPAYKNLESTNCWDLPKNNCKAHGNECSTCFIKTEFQTRK
jgi:HD-GYP domain-containing protein (c-di-GMP phosphodiesterase class II)